jgi:hypothetical protein
LRQLIHTISDAPTVIGRCVKVDLSCSRRGLAHAVLEFRQRGTGLGRKRHSGVPEVMWPHIWPTNAKESALEHLVISRPDVAAGLGREHQVVETWTTESLEVGAKRVSQQSGDGNGPLAGD